MPGSSSGITGRSSLGEICFIHTLLGGNTSGVRPQKHGLIWERVLTSATSHRLSMTAQVSLCCPYCLLLPLWASHKQSTFIVYTPTYTDTYIHNLCHIGSSVDMPRRCKANSRSKSLVFVENYQPFVYSVYTVIHSFMMVLTASNYYLSSKRKRWLYLSKKALISAGTEDFRFSMVQRFLLTFKAAS